MFGLVRTWFDICEKKIDLILSAIVTQMLTNNSFEFANGSFYILSKWINASVRIKLQKVTKNSINFPDIVEWKHYPGDNNWIIDCIHCMCFFIFACFILQCEIKQARVSSMETSLIRQRQWKLTPISRTTICRLFIYYIVVLFVSNVNNKYQGINTCEPTYFIEIVRCWFPI